MCLTKQNLNMFKLWCEWGISYAFGVSRKYDQQNLRDVPESLKKKKDYL